MSLPETVQATLGGESVAARVDLGGEDLLLVTPTRTIVYRAEGLLSDEAVEEFPHDAEYVGVSEKRRKSKITLDYGLDGERSFTVPTKQLDQVLHPVLAGVLNAAAITDPVAAFLTPLADGTRAQLVAPTGAAGTTGVRLDELRTWFGPAFETVPDPFPALDQYDLEYRQPARVAPTSLSVDGVTLVGAAARAAIPEGCLGPALGIEDAWVAADTLAYGPSGLEKARRAYETRRRDRERDIELALADSTADDRAPRPLSPQLRRLYLDRRLAFSHVIDGGFPDVAREIPARL